MSKNIELAVPASFLFEKTKEFWVERILKELR